MGEYTSLVFAGSLSFEDGLLRKHILESILLEAFIQVVIEFTAVDLINVRARAMQNASNNVSSGMMTVFLRSSSKLGDALEAAKLYVPPALEFLVSSFYSFN